MLRPLLLVAAAAALPAHSASVSKVYACQTARSKAMGFCDSSKSFTERAGDLLQQLTTAEKISLMGAHGSDICAFEDGGVPRLDIPSYTWCTETNTGVSSVCLQEGRCATTFPSPAALASSFNRSLWRRKGETQSTEQRALFNLGAVRGSRNRPLIGLNGWGPNINTVRGEPLPPPTAVDSAAGDARVTRVPAVAADPRYGRNSELPSECPTLNGAYAIEEVRGMQEGDDPKWPLKIHATLKHYTVCRAPPSPPDGALDSSPCRPTPSKPTASASSATRPRTTCTIASCRSTQRRSSKATLYASPLSLDASLSFSRLCGWCC